MSSKGKSEEMKRRWQEQREKMLADTAGATRALKAMPEADKCIQQWRSARMRWKVQDREAMRG